MQIIDALRYKIGTLLCEGRPNPLNQARQGYGTEDDIHTIVEEFKKPYLGHYRYKFLDLTPFVRIGSKLEYLVSELDSANHLRPVLLTMSEGVFRDLRTAYEHIPVLTAVYDDRGYFNQLVGGSELDQNNIKHVLKQIKGNADAPHLSDLRLPFTDRLLTELLFSPDCRDIPSAADRPDEIKYISGKYYRVMKNKMLVSSYLNLKKLGTDTDALLKVAYEAVLRLTDFFRRDVDPGRNFEALVTTNNTGLFLASTVQSIMEKRLVAIDKLGQIPALQIQRNRLAKELRGEKVVLIEEVVAAGNEVDRAVMFLNFLDTKIHNIIAFYDLEIGQSMMAAQIPMISLCKPKKKLDYVYRSQ